jgi:molybdopterin synthase sulfur carrier subunit
LSTISLGNDAGNIAVMAVIVRIPTTMRPLTGGDKQVSVEPGTLSEIVTELESAHPGLGDRLIDEDGALRKFVNIFVDDDDVRYLDGLDTKVADGITVSIIPAVAGG